MDTLKGKTVLITGAGRGIGRELAEMFAAQQATVCLNDISPLNVEETAQKLTSAGAQARAYVVDIAKKISAQALINQVTDDWGGVDILVNAAAVAPVGALLDMDEWDLSRTVQVNLIGAFLMTQSIGRIMRAQGGGLILNIAPLAQVNSAAYLVSKFGLAGLTRQAAQELQAHNIRVNLLGSGLDNLKTHTAAQTTYAEAALSFALGEWRAATGYLIDLS